MLRHASVALALVFVAAAGCGQFGGNSSSTGKFSPSTSSTTSAITSGSSSGSTATPGSSSTTGSASSVHANVSDVGDPSGAEQEMLELANRARRDPTAEGKRLGLNLSNIPATPPLAPNALLRKAALDHSSDMAVRRFFDHVNPSGQGPHDRILATGYDSGGDAENIAVATGSAFDAKAAHAQFMIDQGVNPPGHRYNILGYYPAPASVPTMRQLGVALTSGQIAAVGAQWDDYCTQDFGVTKSNKPFVTGVAFDDKSGSGDYDDGEGLGKITVTLTASDGTKATAITSKSGGFAFEVLDAGDYVVTFSGGPFGTPATASVKVANDNVKVDAVAGKGAVVR